MVTTKRDYDAISEKVREIQAAVEQGFDTRSDDAYEYFAGEGMFGDPADLSDYSFIQVEMQLETIHKDAMDYLNELFKDWAIVETNEGAWQHLSCTEITEVRHGIYWQEAHPEDTCPVCDERLVK